MLRTSNALSRLTPQELAQFKQAALKSLRHPGKVVRLDRAVWQRLEGAMSEAYRDKLSRLLDKEQSIQEDVMRMRIG